MLAARGEPSSAAFRSRSRAGCSSRTGCRTGATSALLELNRLLAGRAPALVVSTTFTDADPDSLDWLAFAARRLRPHRARGARGAHAARSCPATSCCVAAVQRARGRGAAACRARPRGRRRLRRAPATARPAAGRCWSTSSPSPRGARVHETVTARPGHDGGPAGSPAYAERQVEALTPRDARTPGRAIVAPRRRGRAARGGRRSPGSGPTRPPPPTTRLRDAGPARGAAAIGPPLLARALYDGDPSGAAGAHARGGGAFGGAAYHLLRSEPSRGPVGRRHAAPRRRAAARPRPAGGRGPIAAPGRPRGRRGRAGELLLELAECGAAARRRRGDRQLGGGARARRAARPGRRDRSHARCSPTAARRTRSRSHDADPAELHAGARLLAGARRRRSRRGSRRRRTRRPCGRAGRSRPSARPAASRTRCAGAGGAGRWRAGPRGARLLPGLRGARLVGPPRARPRAPRACAGPRAAPRLGRRARARRGRARGRRAARG